MSQENPKNQKTIFVVEDDQFLVRAYQIKFEKEGVNVWIAYDGKEALAMMEKDQVPNVVLLDLILPGVNGFDVLASIRRSPTWKQVPVIILTNLGQDEDIQRGKELGAQEYIVKADVRINDVVEMVKKYL
jgi:DNA-binding response OmpR family regulator